VRRIGDEGGQRLAVLGVADALRAYPHRGKHRFGIGEKLLQPFACPDAAFIAPAL